MLLSYVIVLQEMYGVKCGFTFVALIRADVIILAWVYEAIPVAWSGWSRCADYICHLA